ncbi:hypothetical protein PTTG_08738 [Puccinia triticina 1-1 BBBD Race 1]|uniref:SET domain-containing protein n=1 Tax=Puccinia triticina (isolate 1-1 / race 1 (BBBD)) TaxID=630390 RepID=A0A180H1H9_PUCT1|nr:hypothetical protein PTTG_08738 [Puccinia triticina 1-1 BBBD Race 1]
MSPKTSERWRMEMGASTRVPYLGQKVNLGGPVTEAVREKLSSARSSSNNLEAVGARVMLEVEHPMIILSAQLKNRSKQSWNHNEYAYRVKEFFKWTATQLVDLHPQLRLSHRSNYAIRLCPSTDHHRHDQQRTIIPSETTVASIPKRACFSHRTSSLADTSSSLLSSLSTLPIDHQHIIRLTIHLIHELSLGPSSPWHPYLNLIGHPEHQQPLLIHLQVDDLPEIRSWLRGTEIERLLQTDRIISLSRLQEIHKGTIAHSSCTWQTFLKAFTIVSSRAFQIDHFHHLALVPIADLFDHSDQPDVEMVSQDLVCDQCGASAECMHDNSNPLQPIEIIPVSEEDTVEIVAIHPLVPPTLDQLGSSDQSRQNEEQEADFLPSVYNTYGKLSNARLLTEYGFMIDANTHDKVHFDLTEVADNTDGQHCPPEQVQVTLRELAATGVFEDDAPNELVGELSEDDTRIADLSLDSNARLSPLLWLTILFYTHAPSPGRPALSAGSVRRLLALQSSLLNHHPPPLSAETTDSLAHLLRVAQLVQKLCRARLTQYHLPHTSIDELLTLKEELVEPEVPSTSAIEGGVQSGNRRGKERREMVTMAIGYACSERILLDTCISLWDDLHSVLLSFTTAASISPY